MRKIREIIRLAFDTKLSGTNIAASQQISRAFVFECIRRAKNEGLSWPLPEHLDDANLDALLYGGGTHAVSLATEPNFEEMHKELRKKGVNLSLLWQEYCEDPATARPLSYSQFCKRYRKWLGTINLVMRQEHLAGEKLFVDYAGHTRRVIDMETGDTRSAQIFVSTLGASYVGFGIM
jgi:transposase